MISMIRLRWQWKNVIVFDFCWFYLIALVHWIHWYTLLTANGSKCIIFVLWWLVVLCCTVCKFCCFINSFKTFVCYNTLLTQTQMPYRTIRIHHNPRFTSFHFVLSSSIQMANRGTFKKWGKNWRTREKITTKA